MRAASVFHLLLHGAEIVEDRHALGKDAAARERKPVLRQIAGADAFRGADRAVVEGFHSAENLQQRGFAGAIRAHQADPVLGRDQPVGFFEEEFVAVAFSGGGKLDHGLGSIVSWERTLLSAKARGDRGMCGD